MNISFGTSGKRKKPPAALLMLLGIPLFLFSFVMLWMNEGRVNFGRVAQRSVAVLSNEVASSAQGKLVAAAGPLIASEPVGDPAFVQPGNYLLLSRTVEMYAWIENEHDADGNSNNPIYEYVEEWTAEPPDSREFHRSDLYFNPPLPAEPQTFRPAQARLGVYHVDLRALELPEAQPLRLTRDMLLHPDEHRIESPYLYVGKGTLAAPQIGDVRLSYEALEQGLDVTLFGILDGERLVPATYRGNQVLYRAFAAGREQAIVQMRQEYTAALWGTRVAGLIAMWLGLFLLLLPLTGVLSFIPLLHRAGKMLLAALTFGVALLLTTVTVVVAFLAHNVLVLVAVLLLLAGGGIVALKLRAGTAGDG